MAGRDTSIIGKQIAGYQVMELVGRGAMGAVYKGRQLSLGRVVALKILAPHLAENEEYVARFRREARSIAQVNHPNILQVHDVGTENDLHYIVMEFIDGRTLTAMLERDRGFLEWRVACDYMIQAARGLAGAAQVNIIHRDVKPDNLMITSGGVIKVSDFGLAKDITAVELTSTGDVMGTPAYMSPEQCDGEPLDTRTDIYSLGATFYRALTGMLPFTAPSPVAVMYKHKHEPLVPPRDYMPSVPEEVQNVILRMMAKNRDDRYATMNEVAAAIEEALVRAPAREGEPTLQFPGATKDFDFSGAVAKPKRTAPPSPAPAAPPAPPPPDAAQMFEAFVAEGERLAKDGRLLAAGECWKRALELRPGDAEVTQRLRAAQKDSAVACMRIGTELLAKGRLAALRSEYERKKSENPDDLDAREKLAALDYMDQLRRDTLMEIRKQLSAGEIESALAKWEELHPTLRDKALQPTMDNLKNRVVPARQLAEQAEAQAKAGQYEAALALWDQAIALDSGNDKLKLGRRDAQNFLVRRENQIREGYEQVVQRRFETAIAVFEAVLEQSPGHPPTLKCLREACGEMALESERKADFEKAVVALEKLREIAPDTPDLANRLEAAQRQRNQLAAALDGARKALESGRYGRSLRSWRRALAIQPGNKAAVFGLNEARRQWFKYRLLPLLLGLLLVVGGGLIYLNSLYSGLVGEGDARFVSAERGGGEEEFLSAVGAWREAAQVSLFGRMHRSALNRKIAEAQGRGILARVADLYARKALPELAAQREPVTAEATRLEGAGPMLSARIRFGYFWRLGHLLALNGRPEEAAAAYVEARRQEATAEERLLLEQDGIARAIDLCLDAQTQLQRPELPLAQRDKEAGELLTRALELWPEFALADQRLKQLRGEREFVNENLRQARRLLELARNQTAAEAFEAAERNLDQAKELSDKVLARQPESWDARKLAAEIAWRREAGREMVFFVNPLPDDPDAKWRFAAFALDRYEWPNRAGQPPQAVTFKEALKLAEQAGKVLPTRNEWLRAATEGAPRAYSYGDRYDPALANVTGALKACGENPHARTASGLHDLTGNLAEWVVDPERGPDVSLQLAAGGHYESGPDSRNDQFIPVKADVRDPHVGFRAAKRWLLKLRE